MITLPSVARSCLLDHLRHLKEMRDALTTIESNLATRRGECAELNDSFNRRERYLGGWFGGDREKVHRHNDLLEECIDLEAQFDRKQKVIDAIQHEMFLLLDRELAADPDYAALGIMCGDGRSAEASAKHLIQLLQRALREVDEAQTANMMDAAGLNSMAAYDYIATDEARQAVAAVNRYLPEFQRFVGRFMRADAAGPAVPNLDAFLATLDITDLVLDFGFGDFAQIGELDRTEEVLRSHLAKAETVAAQIAEILVPLKVSQRKYHDEVIAALH